MIGNVLLERFTVTHRIGEGGMGVVYRASQPDGPDVAIKRLHAEVATSPMLVGRFQREATAQSMLVHPNIAILHAVGGMPDGGLCFVMELVEGGSLADALDHGPLAPAQAFTVIRQVLSALHHAHQFGMVHRDLKPENVLLDRDQGGSQPCAKLIDFGLVKMLNDVLGHDECQRLTTTGMVFGTPDYMAPEQIMGGEVDARTDLYAVGVMLFEMLTGRPLFEYEEVSELWQAHLADPIPPLASVAPWLADSLPCEDLDGVLAGLLGKRPDQRFASAHAVSRALGTVVS